MQQEFITILAEPIIASLILLVTAIALYIISERLTGLAYQRVIMLADVLAVVSVSIIVARYHLLDWLWSLIVGLAP